jgi:16S rRNA (guanine527-N7)-methyltransferase
MSELTELLEPFTACPLSTDQLEQLHAYLDLLLKWNAKISLTAVRKPEDIIQRHFGESLFAGEQTGVVEASTLIDVGSGAGFPGVPMAILAPRAQVTLIESQQKKAAFLREVVRALELKTVSVYAGRAEQLQLKSQIVTMRAVEKFQSSLPIAASLVQPDGKLTLMIGASQAETASQGLPEFVWTYPIAIPKSRERILLIGKRDDRSDRSRV